MKTYTQSKVFDQKYNLILTKQTETVPALCAKTIKITEESDPEFSISSLTKKACESKASDSSSATKTSTRELQLIIQEIAIDRKSETSDAFAALALLAQMGATSSRTQGGVSVTINETNFSIEIVRKIVKKVTNKSFRRIAKTFATEFKEIAQSNKYYGNLLKKIQLHYPQIELSDEDKYWCSDFQSENEDCPSEIREILNKYYKDYIQKK